MRACVRTSQQGTCRCSLFNLAGLGEEQVTSQTLFSQHSARLYTHKYAHTRTRTHCSPFIFSFRNHTRRPFVQRPPRLPGRHVSYLTRGAICWILSWPARQQRPSRHFVALNISSASSSAMPVSATRGAGSPNTYPLVKSLWLWFVHTKALQPLT